MTIPRFDLFRIDNDGGDGGLCWIGTADDVTEAQKLLTKQPSAGLRDFVLFDLRTGAKQAIKSGDFQPQNRWATAYAVPLDNISELSSA